MRPAYPLLQPQFFTNGICFTLVEIKMFVLHIDLKSLRILYEGIIPKPLETIYFKMLSLAKTT